MNPETTDIIGEPLDRVDGRLKVTGRAKYSADVPADRLVYAVLITSSIAKGRITHMDIEAATRVPGVIAVLTPFNATRMTKGSIEAQTAAAEASAQQAQQSQGSKSAGPKSGGQPKGGAAKRSGPADRKIHLLQETDVFYNGQPIGLAVADTPERAAEAASRVFVRYQEEHPTLQMRKELHQAYRPKSTSQLQPDTRMGDIDQGWREAEFRVEATYVTPPETHNALEPHATVAVWDDPNHLTLYDATQGIFTVQKRLADLFDLAPEDVHIISHFIGGGFGSKGPVWSHVPLAAMAARQVGRPVKLVLTRRQMFGPVGFRGETVQTLRLGAKSNGALTIVKHDGIVQTSAFDEFVEPVGSATKMLYACPQITTSHRAVRVNTGTPSYTRAPGEASGMFALECAMDELAYRLNMDPVEFRLSNYANADPESGKPFSSKSLSECYRVGSEKFGWSARSAKPGASQDNNRRELIGYGMASATYPAHRSPSSALVRILADGTATVQCGTQDIGTGTYTIMTQIAAETLGLSIDKVHAKLGDTNMPIGAHSGGSQTAASVGSAVIDACRELKKKIADLASSDQASPLRGVNGDEIVSTNGGLYSKSDLKRGESYTALLRRNSLAKMEVTSNSKPGDEQQKYAMHAFGAHFAEVHVDRDLGIVRVTRYTGAFAAGRILNAKTARNQFLGGITWGISMALLENTQLDPRTGRVINADLAEYYVPVNADVPSIDVHFIDENDPYVNPIGVKGVGELGIVGAAAAIANAVYNATGKRIRELPITVDKLI